jgi:hypothetical protein
LGAHLQGALKRVRVVFSAAVHMFEREIFVARDHAVGVCIEVRL